jgi:hypothetical protein
MSAALDTVLETPVEEISLPAGREESVSSRVDPSANGQMPQSSAGPEHNVALTHSTPIHHDPGELDFTQFLNQDILPPPMSDSSLLSEQLASNRQTEHVRRATIDFPVDYGFTHTPYPPPVMCHSASYEPVAAVRPVPVPAPYMAQGSNFSFSHIPPLASYSYAPHLNHQFQQATDLPVLMTHSHSGSSSSLSSAFSTSTSTVLSNAMSPRQRSQSMADIATSAFVPYSIPPAMLPPPFFIQGNECSRNAASQIGTDRSVRSVSMDVQSSGPWTQQPTQPQMETCHQGGGLVGSSLSDYSVNPPPLSLFSTHPLTHNTIHERSHSMGLSMDMSNKLSLASSGNGGMLNREWRRMDVGTMGVVPGEYQPSDGKKHSS